MHPIVPRTDQRAIVPAEMVRENIRTAISQMPELVSFDVTDDENEMLSLRCAVDPGIPAAQREGWGGNVVKWWVGTYDVTDEKTGEIVTLPSLVLITDNGELARFSGWPAIKAWANLLRAASAERCIMGIKVRVSRRKSGTSPGSYWIVLPDA